MNNKDQDPFDINKPVDFRYPDYQDNTVKSMGVVGDAKKKIDAFFGQSCEDGKTSGWTLPTIDPNFNWHGWLLNWSECKCNREVLFLGSIATLARQFFPNALETFVKSRGWKTIWRKLLNLYAYISKFILVILFLKA